MKLENIDAAKLQLEKIPKFETCPCELCDDGCFDRAGYKHHPQCRRKASQRTKFSRATRCPLTHYQATFLAAIDPTGKPEDHRRYPFPPPRDNEIPISFSNGSMSGLSSQQEHYQAPPVNAIKKRSELPVKQVSALSIGCALTTGRFFLQKDNLVLMRSVPMETKSLYQSEYVEKPVIPVSLRPLKNPTIDSR